MQVISTVWFRTDAKRNRPIDYYTYHWPYLLRLFPLLYPNFKLMWYVQVEQLDLVASFTKNLSFVELVPVVITHMSTGHLQRLRPCWDNDVETVGCCDCDSVPSIREAVFRHTFNASHFQAGVLRDCRDHTGQMLGGLCGWKSKSVKYIYENFSQFIETHEPQQEWQYSQWHTKEQLWDKLQHKVSYNHDDAYEDATQRSETARRSLDLPDPHEVLNWLPKSFVDRYSPMVPICGGGATDYAALDLMLKECGR